MLRVTIVAALLCLPALAEASAYETWLNRLDGKVGDLGRGGWTSRDVRELEREVSARPSPDPSAYITFTRVLEHTLALIETGGVISTEVRVLKLVASTAPKSKTGRRDQYEAFMKVFAGACERAWPGGIVSQEVEVIRIVSTTSPSRTLWGREYDSAYKSWSDHLARVERKLNSGGLVSSERKVLDIFRSVQPASGGAGQPSMSDSPSMGSGQPSMSDSPSMGSAGSNEYCGKRYRAERSLERRSRRGPRRMVLQTRRDRLLEIDAKSCTESWIAGNVENVLDLGRVLAVRQKNGTVLLVTWDNGVHRLTGHSDRIEADGRRGLRIVSRRGTRNVELGRGRRRPTETYLDVTIDGRSKRIPRLYNPVARHIE